jgi:hypothetical protein
MGVGTAAGARPRIANNGPSANSSALRAAGHTPHLGRDAAGGGWTTA